MLFSIIADDVLQWERMKKIDTDPNKIKNLLTRGVEEIFVAKHLKDRLASGEVLRVKLGIDPTGPRLHLGRALILWKLKEFQELGHKIVLIIGDFTALIGDPSDKLSKRPFLTEKQVTENMRTYKKQIGKILDINKIEWRYNSEWLQAMTFLEVAKLAESFSVQQMLARRNFKERYQKGVEISLREFLYPLMQGYDSAAIRCDVEVGGTDQLFNLHAGRIVQELYHQPPQDIMTFTMLEGIDGRKMSTTWGNVINIDDEAEEMYGKIMSLVDSLIIKYFWLTTRVPAKEIEEIDKQLKQGGNPKEAKSRLAYEIVSLYHGAEKARLAANRFELIHKYKQIPQDLPTFRLSDKKELPLVNLLVVVKLAKSNSEARRLIGQGGVKINDQVITDWQAKIKLKPGTVVKVGNRRFAKII